MKTHNVVVGSHLATRYLGMELKCPIVASAGPLAKDVDNIRRMEDVGMGAVVLHSLFEEQIELESLALDRGLSGGAESFHEAIQYFPDMGQYNIGPDAYLEHIRKAKAAVNIPIIASLNGATPGGWIHYAGLMEQAGADALELNLYFLPTDPEITGSQVESQCIKLVRDVVRGVKIPVAVKIGPYFSSIAHVARDLDEAGAGAIVLFNRFYQPDYDLQTMEVVPNLHLSTSAELPLRLHWTALLSGRIKADLAITGGVHTAIDVLKSMMAGARVAMTTSALLKYGIDYVPKLLTDLDEWMTAHEYESIQQMQGSLNYLSVPDPAAYERANYMRVLSSYQVRHNGH